MNTKPNYNVERMLRLESGDLSALPKSKEIKPSLDFLQYMTPFWYEIIESCFLHYNISNPTNASTFIANWLGIKSIPSLEDRMETWLVNSILDLQKALTKKQVNGYLTEAAEVLGYKDLLFGNTIKSVKQAVKQLKVGRTRNAQVVHNGVYFTTEKEGCFGLFVAWLSSTLDYDIADLNLPMTKQPLSRALNIKLSRTPFNLPTLDKGNNLPFLSDLTVVLNRTTYEKTYPLLPYWLFGTITEFDLFTLTNHETDKYLDLDKVQDFKTKLLDYKRTNRTTKTIKAAAKFSPNALYYSWDIDYKYRAGYLELGHYPDAFRGLFLGKNGLFIFSLCCFSVFKGGVFQTATLGNSIIKIFPYSYAEYKRLEDFAQDLEDSLRNNFILSEI